MYGPNTTTTEEPEVCQPEWREPFPEPNTIPSGWSFSAPATTSAVEVDEPPAEN